MKFVGNLFCEVTKKCHEKAANMIINTPLHKHFIEENIRINILVISHEKKSR